MLKFSALFPTKKYNNNNYSLKEEMHLVIHDAITVS